MSQSTDCLPNFQLTNSVSLNSLHGLACKHVFCRSVCDGAALREVRLPGSVFQEHLPVEHLPGHVPVTTHSERTGAGLQLHRKICQVNHKSVVIVQLVPLPSLHELFPLDPRPVSWFWQKERGLPEPEKISNLTGNVFDKYPVAAQTVPFAPPGTTFWNCECILRS